jgi:hypothetical protein
MKQLVYDMTLVNDNPPNNYDYFIFAGGSDYRAYEVVKKYFNSYSNLTNLILFQFVERKSAIEPDDAYFDYRKLLTLKLQEIECNIKSPTSCLERILEVIPEDPSLKIGLDISCFTKPYFFYLIKLLKERFKLNNIDVFYTEPQSYIFPKGLFASFHSSSGPLTVREINGFNGFEARNSKKILIFLLGFDGDITQEITIDVAPLETFVVNGFPGYAPKFKDISLVINEKLTTNPDIAILYSRANNPFEVYNLLEGVKKRSKNCFLNIAPLGTKPMALGACLYAIHNPDVRVIYPIPEKYENVTTESCLNSWRYNIILN